MPESKEAHAARMRKLRAEARDIKLPAIADINRRTRAEQDIFDWLDTYFPHRFTGAWTQPRRDMVEAILRCIRYGGDQSIAAERGGGKTTIAEAVIIAEVLQGAVRFPVLFGATGPNGRNILGNIKAELETNDHLLADYPEVCVPIRALEGAPQRAGSQTVHGKPTRIRWKEDHIILPAVPGSKCSGAIIFGMGIDGSVRGLRKGSIRPDLALIDDPDNEQSAESETETNKRMQTIDRAIKGLAGPDQKIARVILCTILNKRCLAFQYTDPAVKPSWNGRRYRLIVKWPEDTAGWDHYMMLRQQGQQSGSDPDGREATRYYLANRERMDAGAEVSDPGRYIQSVLVDGDPAEYSTLQHCYNIIADVGMEAFQTEYQNDPPEEETPESTGLTVATIQSRLNGRLKGIVPIDKTAITVGVDVGKYALHWSVVAWRPGAEGCIIDYGVQEVYNADAIGIDKAIVQALHTYRETLHSDPYLDENGQRVLPSMICVDSGYRDSAVISFVREVGGDPWRMTKGHGQGRGLAPFRAPTAGSKTPRRFIGEHWYASKLAGGAWLFNVHADWWKRWVHDRFATPVNRPASLGLFGEDPRQHLGFAKHLTAEEERTEFSPGKGLKTYWHPVRKTNHWFDATALACVAGSMVGISILPGGARVITKPQTTWYGRRARHAS